MATQAQTNGTLALEQKNRVIIIPAHDEIVARKLRVAAYARVSSSSEDQLNSYRAQNQYYSELISGNPDWEMVDIYADSGITGTSVDKREDFKRMMADCRKGKIDRILVKSISRFARNTKDCLAAVRELKELGVSVLFEEQGIDTARVSSEMVTAIMASLAQKQSESISGNVKWGVQKRMQDGTFIPSYLPYGYRLVNKQIQINDAEAAIVQKIFSEFLAGNSTEKIAEALCVHKIPCKNGKVQWDSSSIRYILRNEKYTGKLVAVEQTSGQWGAITREITALTQDAEASQDWNTDLNPAQLDDGNSVDMYKINKPKVLELKFYGTKVLQRHITRFRDQIAQAFTSEAEFMRFYEAVMIEFRNDIETDRESGRRATMLNYMAGLSSMGEEVDLTAEFNTKHKHPMLVCGLPPTKKTSWHL